MGGVSGLSGDSDVPFVRWLERRDDGRSESLSVETAAERSRRSAAGGTAPLELSNS